VAQRCIPEANALRFVQTAYLSRAEHEAHGGTGAASRSKQSREKLISERREIELRVSAK
jgi:hypothetical protein